MSASGREENDPRAASGAASDPGTASGSATPPSAASGDATALRPFEVTVPDEELADLHRRLTQTRWPEAEPVAGWEQGAPLAWVRELCERWRDGYEWRRLESRLNSLPQFTTEIDGLRIHFLHVRSPEPDATPLVITHGWPGSVVELLDVLAPLTDPCAHGGEARDAFHVACPSLPGYGWSGKPTEPGWGAERIAAAWAELMTRLGYERFGAQGGDWGSAVSTALAAAEPERVAGVHLNYAPVGPDKSTFDDLTEAESRALADMAEHVEWGMGYSQIQATRPQTLGYGLIDSPAGLCAWIGEKLWAWTDHGGDPRDAIGSDAILDLVSVYWHTRTAASAARLYWEEPFARPSGRERYRGAEPLPTPVGISIFPREIMRPSRRWCERRYSDIRFFEELDSGGHFAALEQPQLFVDQVRRAFRAMA